MAEHVIYCDRTTFDAWKSGDGLVGVSEDRRAAAGDVVRIVEGMAESRIANWSVLPVVNAGPGWVVLGPPIAWNYPLPKEST